MYEQAFEPPPLFAMNSFFVHLSRVQSKTQVQGL